MTNDEYNAWYDTLTTAQQDATNAMWVDGAGHCERCLGPGEIYAYGDDIEGWRTCPVCHGSGERPGDVARASVKEAIESLSQDGWR